MKVPPIDRAQLVATRRELHQHPELGFEEQRTSKLIAERLEQLGYAVRTGVGKTGVLAQRDGAAGRCVLLRADMDALPVEEANDVPYRSQHPGRMHACGHDGHVAIGLEVARRLHAAYLPGSLKLAFQPAEEISYGAEAMIRDGALVMPGAVMASVDEFEITILGRGGHAAAPHQTTDPVLIAAHIVTGLQSLVSRRRNPFEEGVVSVTQLNAGHAFNVIPGRAELRGTVRTFGGQFFEHAPRLVEQTTQGIAAAFGATAEVRYRRLTAPLVNDERMTQLMHGVAQDIVGPERVIDGVRTMGGEDMSFFLAKVPGTFAFVGSAPPGTPASPHHSPTFDIDEEALAIGAELLTRTVVRYLEFGGGRA